MQGEFVRGYVYEPWLNRWQLRHFPHEWLPRFRNNRPVLYLDIPYRGAMKGNILHLWPE